MKKSSKNNSEVFRAELIKGKISENLHEMNTRGHHYQKKIKKGLCCTLSTLNNNHPAKYWRASLKTVGLHTN